MEKIGTGISPKYLETIIGLKVTKNIKEDDVITWEML
ncbi:SAF domain-containing protein [Bacillus cereus]